MAWADDSWDGALIVMRPESPATSWRWFGAECVSSLRTAMISPIAPIHRARWWGRSRVLFTNTKRLASSPSSRQRGNVAAQRLANAKAQKLVREQSQSRAGGKTTSPTLTEGASALAPPSGKRTREARLQKRARFDVQRRFSSVNGCITIPLSTLSNLRPRCAEDSNCSNHQQPEWNYPDARYRL